MRLYKYIKVSRTVNGQSELTKKFKTSLQESRLLFSHPAGFNDPLECTIPIKIENYEAYREEYLKYIEELLAEQSNRMDNNDRRRRAHEAIEFGIPVDNCLLACFSEQDNNQLMWAHYADQHRGICLGYEFPNTKEEWDAQIKWSKAVSEEMEESNLRYCGQRVSYRSNRPALNIADTSLPIDEWVIENDYNIGDAIFTKPKCWSYEKEWRLALMYPVGSEKAFSPGSDTQKYYAALPREWLKEITFGLRLDEKLCEEIVDIVKASGYENVSFRREKIVQGRFEVTSVPYEPREK